MRSLISEFYFVPDYARKAHDWSVTCGRLESEDLTLSQPSSFNTSAKDNMWAFTLIPLVFNWWTSLLSSTRLFLL